MRHSKITSILLPQIFLFIIFKCVQGDDIYYPDLEVNGLLKLYPNLPPLGIIPGKTLVTPSTSIDELEKDLEIINQHFIILSRDESVAPDWNARCNLSRQYAFLKLLKYKDLHITNPATKKMLSNYLQIAQLIASFEDNINTFKIRSEGFQINKKYYDAFENELLNGCTITTEKQDAELQRKWKFLSEKAGEEMKPYLDKYVRNIDALTKKYGKVIGINDSLTFWYYYNEYDFITNNELKKLWSNELKHPYQKLLKHERKNFPELFEYYTNIEEDNPMPAYIFDFIFLTHSALQYEKYKGYTSTQIKKRIANVWNIDRTGAPKLNLRTLTEEVQKFYESIGFPKLKKMFWRKSIFENVGNNISHEMGLFSYIENNEAELAVQIRGAVIFRDYQKILNVLLDYHRRRLLILSGKPRILWELDSEIFQEAFFKAVMMSATSVQKLTSLGFMKKNPPEEEYQYYFGANAVTQFTGLAFAMTSHTWKADMIGKNIGPKDRLAEYWNRRKKFEFVVPKTHSPEDADTRDLFDVYSGARVLDEDYNLNYIAVTLLQHQIFARLCEIAGKFNPKRPMDNPLDTCEISGNDKVTEIIRTILIDGPLKTWRELFDMIMGKPNSTISAKEGLLLFYAKFFHNLDRKSKESKGKDHR